MAVRFPTPSFFGLHPPSDLPRSVLYSYTSRVRRHRRLRGNGYAVPRRQSWGPSAREGLAQKHRRHKAVGGFARVLGCPRTPRLSAGENERTATAVAGRTRDRHCGGGVGRILPLLAIADERTNVSFRPYRQGWVFSARVKAVAAAGGKIAPYLCDFRLDTAPKTLHIVDGASAEHKFGKFTIDNERIFVYY